MRRVFVLLAVLMSVGFLVVGCGSPGESALDKAREREADQLKAAGGDTGESTESTESTEETAKEPSKQADEGNNGAATDAAAKQLFTTKCGGCHTLADAGTSGAVGPNLDDLKLDMETILNQIKNGGGGMPAGLITGDDAEAVAAYVAAVSGS